MFPMFPGSKVGRALLSAAAVAALSGTPAVARAEPAPPAQEAAVTPAAARPARAPAPAQAPEDDRMPVTVSFLYPLATNANRPNVTSSVDLSVLHGRVGRLEGLQLGGVVVHASRGVEGAQLGGVATITFGAVTGAQLGGVGNVALEGLSGAQIGGVFNLSTGATTGVQLSGAANVATGDLTGVQLGVVNVGRRVRGLQLGVVNIAEEVDGAAIGLVSISRDSVHPLVWASNLQYMNAGVKFSTKYAFTTLGVHYGTHEADFDHVGATLAIGGRLPLPARFDVEVLGSLTQLAPWPDRSKNRDNTWIAPQVVAGYSFAPRLRAFVGGGVRLPISVDVGRSVSRPEVLAGVQF